MLVLRKEDHPPHNNNNKYNLNFNLNLFDHLLAIRHQNITNGGFQSLSQSLRHLAVLHTITVDFSK